MVKKILVLTLGLALMAALVVPTSALARYTEVGEAIPEFTVSMMNGGSITSAELAAKDKVVITFIQTACSACQAEIIMLTKLTKEMGEGVFVLPIAVDMRSGKEFIDAYKSTNHVDYAFGRDPKFVVPHLFGLSFTPASVVIEKGKVTAIHRGYDDKIKAALTELFK